MSQSVRSARVLVTAVVLLSAASFLLHCGGGTDIAPSSPVIEGQGFGTATIAGRDFGSSSQIDAGVSGVQSAVTTSTDLVTIRPDGYGLLQHGLLSNPSIALTGVGGTPLYCQGSANCSGPTCPVPPSMVPTLPCDFWLADATAGLIQVSPGGTLASGDQATATYSYNERLLTLNVGITFPSGQFLTLIVFNLPSDATATAGAPLTIQPVFSAAPPSPFPTAFNAFVQTNLTTSNSRELFTAVDDAANLLTLTQIDLSNEGRPCLAGTLVVQVLSDADPVQVTLTASFETPGC